MKKHVALIAATLLFVVNSATAEINFTGYASINAGKVLSGTGVDLYGTPPQFLADYPIVSTYDEEWSFKPESIFGIQASADLGDGLSATAQLVARGADDFDVAFEWAYLSYEINDSWTVQAGKKRLPLFYYSDFYDVGYAYVWMRPPADTYTWQIFNYNGINALYTGYWGDWSISGNIYTGEEDSEDNRLLTQFFFLEPTREVWKDILGGVISASNDWFEMRLTHMTYKNERYISGEQVLFNGNTSVDGTFKGLALNADWGNLFILSEINTLETETDFETAMISAGYRFDSITPFIGYSTFEDQEEGGEEHSTTFLGLRWDFHSSAAFKIQYDDVKDKSVEVPVAGDSKSLSIGIDLVF